MDNFKAFLRINLFINIPSDLGITLITNFCINLFQKIRLRADQISVSLTALQLISFSTGLEGCY